MESTEIMRILYLTYEKCQTLSDKSRSLGFPLCAILDF